MASGYPSSLDTFATTSPANLGDDDAQARNHAERHDDIGDAMNKVQAELGTNPSGPLSTVKQRIDSNRSYGLIPGINHYISCAPHYQSGFTPTLNRLYAMPVMVPISMTVDEIQFYLQTAQSSSVVRLGIYANDEDTDRPAALIVDGSTVDTSTGSGAAAASISQALSPGLVWVACAAQGAAGTLQVWGAIPNGQPRCPLTVGSNSANHCYYVDSVSGALPNPFGTIGTSVNVTSPLLSLRRSA